MLTGYPSLLPLLFQNPHPLTERDRVLNQSIHDYYSWGNIKSRVALDVAAGGLEKKGNGSAFGSGLLTYGVLTVGEKLIKAYQRRLIRFQERHPGFEEFVNRRPIVGNILAWTPGVLTTGTVAGVAALLGKRLLGHGLVQGAFNHPIGRRVGSMVTIGGLLLTGFFGILARRGLQSASLSGKEYRELRQVYPEATPKELKQIARAQRNQAAYQQLQEHQEGRFNQVMNPFYNPLYPPSSDSFELAEPRDRDRRETSDPALSTYSATFSVDPTLKSFLPEGVRRDHFIRDASS